MTSPIFEEQQFDIDVEFDDPPEELDPAFLDVAKVAYMAEHILDGLREKRDAGEPIGKLFDQEYVDGLDAVADACRSILEDENSEAIKRDMGRLDDDRLHELRETIADVSTHFGIDVDLPDPDTTEGGE